jgi:molybdopterin synthase sulfur carrier subunit
MVTVRIPAPLRKLTGGKEMVSVEGRTVKEALNALVELYPELGVRIKDESGRLRQFLNVYVNNEDIRFLQEIETPLKDGDQILLIPAIAGGQRVAKRRVTLYFPPERIKEPIVYTIGHRFKIVTNIRGANVTEKMGWVTLEIEGEEEEYLKALSYLKELGVRVEPVTGDVLV